jgi:hypothetical protein
MRYTSLQDIPTVTTCRPAPTPTVVCHGIEGCEHPPTLVQQGEPGHVTEGQCERCRLWAQSHYLTERRREEYRVYLESTLDPRD